MEFQAGMLEPKGNYGEKTIVHGRPCLAEEASSADTEMQENIEKWATEQKGAG